MATATQKMTLGMGSNLLAEGVSFRVWAPFADSVSVIGTFNDWQEAAHPMQKSSDGTWAIIIPEASSGDEYRYYITNGEMKLSRIDPYAREVTNSVGNAVVHDPHYDWEDDDFEMPDWNRLVIYEMHTGTFHREDHEQVGTFHGIVKKLEYLQRLGVNAIELMPTAEFAGDLSWGYNPAHIFAVEQAYGGPNALKRLVKEAHRHGIAVILDVVYNHFGPSDLDLWQFDGWSENNGGGIYFYNDWRAATPWGETRPDYGRGEVRQYIFDNAMMWLKDYRMDGLRYDMTLFIRSVDGTDHKNIPDGWNLAQWINRETRRQFPKKITIAEDLQNKSEITAPEEWGGANFCSQWDANFVHPIRRVVTEIKDEYRSMATVRDAVCTKYNHDAFQRVVYSESHDEVANGKSRVVSEIDPEDPFSRFPLKRSTLAAAMVFTSPGIPMLFQAQEFMRSGWFDDSKPIDWSQEKELRGVKKLYRDLIHCRLNRHGVTAGLTGQHVDFRRVDENNKMVAFRRFAEGGPRDDTMVVANFAERIWDEYRIGLPSEGVWKLRFNSDWEGYHEEMDDTPSSDIHAEAIPCDGYPYSAHVKIGAYAVLILSQD